MTSGYAVSRSIAGLRMIFVHANQSNGVPAIEKQIWAREHHPNNR
jgi:hypothetical protein